MRARRAFSAAVRCFPPSTGTQLETAKNKLSQALRIAPGYSRAKAWLAYALVHGYVEGYAGFTGRRVLDRAKRLIDEADPRHVDTIWAGAFYQFALAADDPVRLDKAVKAYEAAMKRAPGNTDLMVEAAEALTYCGRLRDSEKLLKKAMKRDPEDRPDWYLWDLAWIHFLKAGRANVRADRRRRHLEAALDALDTMLDEPDVPAFQVDSLLLKAAVLWHLGRKRKARKERDTFKEKKPDWSLARETNSVRFKRADDRRHWLSTVELVLQA